MFWGIVYEKLIDNRAEACDKSGDNQPFSGSTYSQQECEKKCNENLECSFISFTLSGWCALYKACEKRRTTNKATSIFKRVRSGNNIIMSTLLRFSIMTIRYSIEIMLISL